MCSRCLVEKDKNEFPVEKRNKSGRAGKCTMCFREVAKVWYRNNTERAKDNSRCAKMRNPQKYKDKVRECYQKNREKYRVANKRWVEANRDKMSVYKRKYYYKNRETILEKERNRKRERYFGISPQEYDDIVNSFMKAQDSSCAICNKLFDDQCKYNLDHCHTTGEFRGLLCKPCNMALGLLKDNTVLFQNAIQYLVNNKEVRYG